MLTLRENLAADRWAGAPVWLWVMLIGVSTHVAYTAITWQFSPVDQWWLAASDSRDYINLAKSILHGEYETVPGDPRFRFYRSPGYPVILAAVSVVTGTPPGAWPAILFQTLLGGIWCALIYSVARRLVDKPEVPLLAGLGATVHPSSLALSQVILTDLAGAASFMLGMWLLVSGVQELRPARLLGSGLVAGWAILIRPAAIITVALWPALVWALPRRRFSPIWGSALVFGSTIALPLLWASIVYAHTGVLAMNTHTSHHLYSNIAHGLVARGIPHLHAQRENEAKAREERLLPKDITEKQRVEWEKAQADSIICANIGGAIPHAARTIAYLLLSPTKEHFMQFPPPGRRSSVVAKAVSVGEMALVVCGFIVMLRRRSYRATLSLCLLLAAVLGISLSAGAMTGMRLMLPAALTFLVGGAVAVWEICRWTCRRLLQRRSTG